MSVIEGPKQMSVIGVRDEEKGERGCAMQVLCSYLFDEEKNERGGYLHKCTNKYAVQGTQANASDRDDGGGKG